jgi:hypothetical protein
MGRDGKWHCTSRRIHIFFYGKGNEKHELDTVVFFYIRETYQKLRALNLLVIGCCT